MTSIPAAICRTSRNNFKRHYLRNKRLYPDFLLHFRSVHQKKHDYPSLIISETINAEKGGYVNVQKVFLPNTIR